MPWLQSGASRASSPAWPVTGHWQAWLFVLAMAAGMLLYASLEARHRR
ncbi:hypothetical protein [Pseudomonas sp. MAHUQ-55]